MSKKYINSEKHRKEHSKWDRRGFMKVLGLAGAGSISLGNTKKTNKTIGFLARKASFLIKTNYFIENTNIFAKQHTKRYVYNGFVTAGPPCGRQEL